MNSLCDVSIDPDVVVVGGGTAGLVTGALLSSEGYKVLLAEPTDRLGGFSATHEVDGYTLNFGGHVLEDPGSGLTAILSKLGIALLPAGVSEGLPVWDQSQGRWSSLAETHPTDRAQWKRVVARIVESEFSDFDEWDDQPLRSWLRTVTTDDGVVELFEFLAFLEFLTENWYDHSASESLYLRKMHLTERRTSGYSWWPRGGWKHIFERLASFIESKGGQVLTQHSARVRLEDHRVRGVDLYSTQRCIPNEITTSRYVDADRVVCAVPAWHVDGVVGLTDLPDWYAEMIRRVAECRNRDSWVNIAFAVDEPLTVQSRTELGVWQRSPSRDRAGFFFEQTGLDPTSAPEGKYLYLVGGAIDPIAAHDTGWLRRETEMLRHDALAMLPGLAAADWSISQLVHEPSIGAASKPSMVGRYLPASRPPVPDGLWFAHETFRGRGVEDDRAARVALSVVEDMIGRRLEGLESTWRY